MSYYIDNRQQTNALGWYDELPDKILVREAGWLNDYKFFGKAPINYWYVPAEQTQGLIELLQDILTYDLNGSPYDYKPIETSFRSWVRSRLRELGIED